MVACICRSPLHHQKPDFEGQSVVKSSSYLLPFVLEAHRESLPRSCETSARRLSAESAEVYSTADLPASAAHIPFSQDTVIHLEVDEQQCKITQGCQKQAQWVWSPRTMSGLRLPDTPHATSNTTIHAFRPENNVGVSSPPMNDTRALPQTNQGDLTS